MKVIQNNEELKSYIVDGAVKFDEDIICDFNINIDADLKARNIEAGNIKCYNLNADTVGALSVYANDMSCWNIDAISINARNISYYAFCIAYKSFVCNSVKGRRNNSIHKCLDGEIQYIKQ